jgi:hypothetical protein
MDQLRVLLANELRSYREVIALALRELRPGVEVIDVEPKELDAEAKRFSPT